LTERAGQRPKKVIQTGKGGKLAMHVGVVLRLVPDISEEIEIDDAGTDISREWIGFKLNEFDDHALEEAVLFKDRFGAKVTAIALAGEGVDRMLQNALARGADEAVRVDHPLERIDSARTAAALLRAPLASLGVDLLVTGVQTIEDVFGQLAPSLAGLLGWPTVNAVVGVVPKDGSVHVQQEYSGGLSAILAVQLPAVLGIQTASQPPRYVSGTKLSQAMKRPVARVEASTSPTTGLRLSALRFPERTSHAEMIDGDASSVACRIIEIFAQRGLLEA
jgi:electron transfer flavoprotein beta subunit